MLKIPALFGSICLLLAAASPARLAGQSVEVPKLTDPRLTVELFAQDPDIVHPIGIAFDKAGRLLVIESHTHFRPADYKGPKHDRILAMQDTTGDGKADKITTFFEGTNKTMDLAVHPDGSVYISPRNEIIRLRDTDGDGKADQKQRIVYLDTKGNYPHNGLSGLVFDAAGNLYFSMGENLGAAYTLIGSDGKKISDESEGGNIFWCTADGKQLRRVATGFWNPFGACLTKDGHLFVTDNDPDSTPPCRLIHVVEGGNYGYQYRYGRSGLHPFQSWNGHLPGTLPMAAGTGEGPCGVIVCRSKNLPRQYQGELLVASWSDHRIERYRLTARGASFTGRRQIMVQGGNDFRPVGLAIGPDGSLYFSDWVLRDYKLHGKGRIWRVRMKDAKKPGAADRTRVKTLPPNQKQADKVSDPIRKQSRQLVKNADDADSLLTLLVDQDPFVATAARMKLVASPGLLKNIHLRSIQDPQKRIGVLLAWRQTQQETATKLIPVFLEDKHEDVRFMAVKWIADQRLETFRKHVTDALARSDISARMFTAYATAAARLDKRPAGDRKLWGFYLKKLKDPKSSPALKAMALRVVPPNHKGLKLEHLTKLLKAKDTALQVEALRSISAHPDKKRKQILLAVIKDKSYDPSIRTWAVLGLADQPGTHTDALMQIIGSETGALRLEALRAIDRKQLSPGHTAQIAELTNKNPALDKVYRRQESIKASKRPAYEDTEAWLGRLKGQGDVEAGRRIFFHPKLAGCFRCHQSEGRGATVGPDLTIIAKRVDRKAVLESILQPNKQVAPRYNAWSVTTKDGQTRIGFLLRQSRNDRSYIDTSGKAFKVSGLEVVKSEALSISVMPTKLVDTLTDQELRDLMAYLMREN